MRTIIRYVLQITKFHITCAFEITIVIERFNEYFINNVRDICNSIGKVYYENNVRISNCRCNFRAMPLIELENICRNMKKKKDYRRISTDILLDNWNTVGNILLRIINKPLETGIFHNQWLRLLRRLEILLNVRNIAR